MLPFLPTGSLAADLISVAIVNIAGILAFRNLLRPVVRWAFGANDAALRVIRQLSAPYYAFLLVASARIVWGVSMPPGEPAIAQFLHHWSALLFWPTLAMLGIEFLRRVLVQQVLIVRRGVQIPGLLQDMAFGLVYLVMGVVFLGAAFRLDVAPFLTGSAVLTIVVGMALQDTLGNLLSGLAIHLDPPFRLGDWVNVNGRVGKVLQITWRATHLLSKEDYTVVIPNNAISKAEILNYNAPTAEHAHFLLLGLSYHIAPSDAIRVLTEVAQGTEGVVGGRAEVQLHDFGDSAVQYRVKVWIDDYHDFSRILSALRTRLWYRLQREGWEIPFPTRHVLMAEDHLDRTGDDQVRDALRRVDFLKGLNEAQLAALAAETTCHMFAPGEVIISEGEPGDSCFVIRKGDVRLSLGSTGTAPLATLSAGKVFGEMSLLTGEPRTATATADTPCELLVLSHDQFAHLLREHPTVSETICHLIAERRAHTDAARRDREELHSRIPQASEAQVDAFSRELARKLTAFFGLN